MKQIFKNFFFTALILLLSWGTTAQAVTKGRIMTNGKVTLYKNGQGVTTYTDQGALDENALISCDGTCMVKMQGISLSAIDQTRFAIKESADALNLFVGSGKIYFIVTDLTRQFVFYSPTGHHIKTEGFIASANTDSAIKGFVEVKNKATEIGMDTGSMVVQTAEGSQTVNPGQTIVLAMADVPDDQKGEEEKGAKEDDDEKIAGFAWENVTSTSTLVGIGVVGAVGLGAFLVWDNNNDAETRSAPPPPSLEPPRPPASRNQ